MAIVTEEIKQEKGVNSIIIGFVFDDKLPGIKHTVYKINKNKKTIEFYPYWKKSLFFSVITIEGFASLPKLLKNTGYSKNKVLDYIHRTFKDKKIQAITISKDGNTRVIKRLGNNYLHIRYSDLVNLSDDLGSMNWAHNTGKTVFAYNFFHHHIPAFIKTKSTPGAKNEIKNALQKLSKYPVESYEKQSVNKLVDILSHLMRSNHRSAIEQSKLFKETKIRFDTITLDQIIQDFEKKLLVDASEASWGQFLENNLVLIDSKYIHALPQLNLVLGGTRKVDFGLIDILGYLDLFEIKKPETKLLNAKKDSRGNFAWHKEALEAIVQAEKYLFHADGKRTVLRDDIKRERDISLEVIRPRAFVILGMSLQLDSDAKKEDFRILRNQFKNIEIILYDEMLERIKNQKKSISK